MISVYLKKLFIFFLLFLFLPICFFGQVQVKDKKGKPVPEAFCIKHPESELYNKINQYRERFNLPPVPLSASLSYVASLHIRDLSLNYHENTACNLHSWSSKGFWTPFCYPKDENKKQSVWDKPSEITLYPVKAYEIVYWENDDLTPDSVLAIWTSEEFYNNYLLNRGKWAGQAWKAMGVAILGNYACAWFGNETDPEGPPLECGVRKQYPPKKDSVQKPGNVIQKSKTEVKPVVKDSLIAKPVQKSASWYIIIKTNISENKAVKDLDTLKSNGYPEASILNKNRKIRIAIFGPADKNTANQKLKEVKKTFKDAWLLSQ